MRLSKKKTTCQMMTLQKVVCACNHIGLHSFRWNSPAIKPNKQWPNELNSMATQAQAQTKENTTPCQASYLLASSTFRVDCSAKIPLDFHTVIRAMSICHQKATCSVARCPTPFHLSSSCHSELSLSLWYLAGPLFLIHKGVDQLTGRSLLEKTRTTCKHPRKK